MNREFPIPLVKMAPVLMLKAARILIYALMSNAISSFVKSVTSVKAFGPDFELYICKRLRRAPYVCNGCDSRKYCRKPIKYFYNPSHAHKEYKEVLVSSRTGINVTEDELKKTRFHCQSLVRDKSQSLNHIFASHAGEIGVSQSTVYNYIDAGFLECANIDLPRRVRFKKRKRKAGKNEVKINKSALRKNRTYNDYLALYERASRC